jgi:YVTN family beta-propeller protein
MFSGTPPSRLRFLALALAVGTALSAGAVWSVSSIGSASSSGVGSGLHHPGVLPSGPPNERGLGPATRSAAYPALIGGAGFVFGVVATIPFPDSSDPVGVATDSANGDVYVTLSHANSVGVIDGSTQQLAASIVLNESPTGIVYDSVNSDVYVGSFFGDTVEVISTATNTVVANVTLPGSPVALACDTNSGAVYVAQQATNMVSVISGSTNLVIATVHVGSNPVAAAFDSANGNLYVANYGSANVSIIATATNTVIGSIPVGTNPLGVAFDSGNGDLYVSNEHSDNTTVISGATEKAVASVPVPGHPVGVAYDPKHSVIGVTAENDGRVTFISNVTNTVVANVSVGELPVGIAYSTVNGDDYVANSNSSNMSVIGTSLPPPYAVTFTETGLPAATNWTVTFAGSSLSSKTNQITFSEVNGMGYPFSVSPIPGYVASPTSGSLTVAGFPVRETITFTPFTYTLTFRESGLPGATNWSVILNLTPQVSNTTSITFQVANGSYSFIVNTVTGYSASPASGNVTIRAGPQTITITFSPPIKPSSSGSSSGIPWWVWAAIAVAIVAVVAVVVMVMRRRPPRPSVRPYSTEGQSPSQTSGGPPGPP